MPKAPAALNERRRRGATARGYGYRWQRYSKARLEANALCVGWPLGTHGSIVACRWMGPDDPLFWEPTNDQSLCQACHGRKTATEGGGFVGRVRRG